MMTFEDMVRVLNRSNCTLSTCGCFLERACYDRHRRGGATGSLLTAPYSGPFHSSTQSGVGACNVREGILA